MTLSLRAYGNDAFMHAHLVHEKAHAFTLPAQFTAELTDLRAGPDGPVNAWDVHMPRGGHILQPDPDHAAGEYIEEGFAELMAAEYARDILGGDGLWPEGRPMPPEIDGDPVPPQLATLPAGYVWQGENGLPICSSTSFADAGIELLVQARPALREALIRARSEISGLRDVARLIDSVAPGLYRRIRQAPYSNEGFGAALDDVRAVTGRQVSASAAQYRPVACGFPEKPAGAAEGQPRRLDREPDSQHPPCGAQTVTPERPRAQARRLAAKPEGSRT
jgi:hypothetical protein